MTDHPLRIAIARLLGLQQAIGELTLDPEDGWRLLLVQKRRELGERIAEIFAIAAGPSQPLATPSGMVLRQALSRLRTAMADHQALWPAVAIDLDDPAYNESRRHLRDLYGKLRMALEAWEQASSDPDRNGESRQ